ncbi:MAG TPA: hypothetical protein VKP61_00055 [Candidatus Acidoferrum sp.]|nr:hypothetical protein [Candidatus Acidoferrum sp.]
MKKAIVAIVEFVSAGRIRGQHCFTPFQPSLRWWYVGTRRFQHGGWIFLSRSWLRRFA